MIVPSSCGANTWKKGATSSSCYENYEKSPRCQNASSYCRTEGTGCPAGGSHTSRFPSPCSPVAKPRLTTLLTQKPINSHVYPTPHTQKRILSDLQVWTSHLTESVCLYLLCTKHFRHAHDPTLLPSSTRKDQHLEHVSQSYRTSSVCIIFTIGKKSRPGRSAKQTRHRKHRIIWSKTFAVLFLQVH